MTARRCVHLIALALAGAAPAAAQSTPAGPRVERTVRPGAPGPNRLAVDSALLVDASPLGATDRAGAGAPRAGLGELRFYDDARHREVPYLFVWPSRPQGPDWLGARPIPVTPRKDTSGFEVDLGVPRTVDRFGIPGLAERQLKRVRLEGSGDRMRWIVLVAEGTVFNLPSEGGSGALQQTTLAFPPATVRYLRLTADDHAGAPLALPRFVEVRPAVRELAEPDTLRSVLAFERRPAAKRTSRFHIRLPASRLPIIALDLDVAGEQLLRPARVTEPRLGSGRVEPVYLGEAQLRRMTLGGAVASNLRVPIGMPEGAELDLVVDDGDNPPLDLRAVRAVYAPLPSIYFESADGAELRAVYGSDRRMPVPPPRYDLEALRDTVNRIPAATASWGAARPVAVAATAAEAPPALYAAPGAPLDAKAFRFARPIPVGAGLTAVRLDAAVLAHSRLDDVRIVDASGRQVPYLLELLEEPTELPLAAAEPMAAADPDSRALPAAGSRSRYRLRLPIAGLPDATLRLETSARVFSRTVTVVTHEIARDVPTSADWVVDAEWRHADPESAAPPLEIALGGHRLPAEAMFVLVDDGDNQKLPIAHPTILLPTYRLRFFRQAGTTLTLLYGRADIGAPRYDIQLIAPRLLDAAATEIAASPEGTDAGGTTRLPQVVFWVVLGVVVLILLLLVARLVRASPAPATGDATG